MWISVIEFIRDLRNSDVSNSKTRLSLLRLFKDRSLEIKNCLAVLVPLNVSSCNRIFEMTFGRFSSPQKLR